MEDFYYDLTLICIDKRLRTCSRRCDYVLTGLFIRLVINFIIDIIEFGILESQSGTSVGGISVVRYIIIGLLSLYIVFGVILLFNLGPIRIEDAEIAKNTGQKIFLLFRFISLFVDGLILSYTVFLVKDFRVVIPFFSTPIAGFNWKAWFISLVCYVDILLGIVEIVLTIRKIMRKAHKCQVGCESEPIRLNHVKGAEYHSSNFIQMGCPERKNKPFNL